MVVGLHDLQRMYHFYLMMMINWQFSQGCRLIWTAWWVRVWPLHVLNIMWLILVCFSPSYLHLSWCFVCFPGRKVEVESSAHGAKQFEIHALICLFGFLSEWCSFCNLNLSSASLSVSWCLELGMPPYCLSVYLLHSIMGLQYIMSCNQLLHTSYDHVAIYL